MNIEDAENARQGTAPADGREWFGLAPVACVGVVFLTVLTAAVLLPMADWSWLAGLEKWQGLIGALVTLLAAIIGAMVLLHTVQKQIDAPQVQARQDRERKKQARRAFLSIDLAQLSVYTEECVKVMRKKRILPADVPLMPVLPDRVIDSLKHFLEYLEGTDVDAVAALIHTYQIQNSRIRKYLTKRPRIEDDIRQMVNVVELRSRINSLYSYARRRSDNIPERPDSDVIERSAAFIRGYSYRAFDHDSIIKQVESRIAAPRRA